MVQGVPKQQVDNQRRIKFEDSLFHEKLACVKVALGMYEWDNKFSDITCLWNNSKGDEGEKKKQRWKEGKKIRGSQNNGNEMSRKLETKAL